MAEEKHCFCFILWTCQNKRQPKKYSNEKMCCVIYDFDIRSDLRGGVGKQGFGNTIRLERNGG